MRTSKPSVWAGLFGAALFSLSAAAGLAATSINGTYAAVTPQSVELLRLQSVKGAVRGTYRVLHLDATQRNGVDDQSTALSTIGVHAESAFALDDSRALMLRFDSKFQRAVATSPGMPGTQTQSFARIDPQQLGLLVEMARYGGLFEMCQAHHDTSCGGMRSRLAEIVPFRPFPQTAARQPVLAYSMTARMDHSLAVNP